MNRIVSKPTRLVGAVVLSALLVSPSYGQQPERAPPQPDASPSIWMKLKLDNSQEILAGIATADFDKIADAAQAMQTLNRIESFARGGSPGYRAQLQIFQDANAEILKQAQQGNVDGAALAFTQMTISCVNCHKRLREEKVQKP